MAHFSLSLLLTYALRLVATITLYCFNNVFISRFAGSRWCCSYFSIACLSIERRNLNMQRFNEIISLLISVRKIRLFHSSIFEYHLVSFLNNMFAGMHGEIT